MWGITWSSGKSISIIISQFRHCGCKIWEWLNFSNCFHISMHFFEYMYGFSYIVEITTALATSLMLWNKVPIRQINFKYANHLYVLVIEHSKIDAVQCVGIWMGKAQPMKYTHSWSCFELIHNSWEPVCFIYQWANCHGYYGTDIDRWITQKVVGNISYGYDMALWDW